MNYSKGMVFLQASLLGGNSPDYVYDLLMLCLRRCKDTSLYGVGLEMYAQDLDAGAWSDGLAITEYLNVFVDVSFGVRADDKEL